MNEIVNIDTGHKRILMNAKCPCRICGKDTLVKTGKTSISFDGVEHRTFVKCLNERCNCEYTLSTAITG